MDPAKSDVRDWTRQLNIYRYLIQKEMGIIVSKLQIFCVVRDGNTIAATSRGVMDSTYLFPLPLYSAPVVEDFIKKRAGEIVKAFETGTARECDAEEAWEGRRCKEFCEVADACRAMGNTWLSKQVPSEDEPELPVAE